MKLVVITGCLGFIGSYVTRSCLDKGWKVYGIDKCTYASKPELLTECNKNENFSFLKEDIATLQSLPDCDYVINIAAETHVGNSILDSSDFIHTNVDGVKNLLDLIRHKPANICKKPIFFHFSTDEVYWDIKEGAAFTEFNRDIHVVEPFDIPRNWVKFRSCDYGYGSYSAVLWFAISPDEQLILYRELYVSKVLATDLAEMVLDLEVDDGNIKYGVLDSSLWHKRGDTGPSLAEQMIQRGCRWRPSDRSKGSRVAGKNEIHRRLQVDEFTEQPRMVFFNTCTNAVAQIPAIPLDKKNPEDVDTRAEDHIYDALRYGIMSRPRFSIFDYDPVGRPQSSMPVADATFGY